MAFATSLCTRFLHNVVKRRQGSGKPPVCNLELYLPTTAHTEYLGASLARFAQRGDVILLNGGLGSGKTCLARGYIRQVRGNPNLDVTSPTYLLDNCYLDENDASGIHVHHMDLWRLNRVTERTPFVDFEQVFANNVSLIEWPDRLAELTPRDRLDVFLRYPDSETPSSSIDEWGFSTEDDGSGDEGRHAKLVPHGSTWEKRLENLSRTSTIEVSHDICEGRVLNPT